LLGFALYRAGESAQDRADPLLGAAGLAAANQVYNAFKASGKALGDGDVTIVDVSDSLRTVHCATKTVSLRMDRSSSC
jgi:hypothetical protein